MLDIYKASAGAGKTHKLTGEYIKLLFSQPNAYRHILAVTFTNKATDEMKQRILQELYLLQKPGSASDYLGGIMEYTGKDEALVRGEAREILISILHDYTSFRVSTIDKFFQMVMRAFARELGRMATYNVELDRDSVLAKAVDRMFSDLDDPKNRKLLEWLIEYSLDAVDKGSSWNVKGEILKLGNQLFSEAYKLAVEKCGEAGEGISVDVVAGYKKNLKRGVGEFEAAAVALGKAGMECISRHSLELGDFKGGSRTPFNYLRTLANCRRGDAVPYPGMTFVALHGNIEMWYTGKRCPAAIEAVHVELDGIVGKIIDLFEDGYREYATSLAILQNVNVMGILNDIRARVVDYCREKNIILLSESTELLGRIIDRDDTPFIYEKIGARLDNFMLDEFQDTSSMQWRNFYPLLQNSLAQGGRNLIVGDVKQSIYRWRGSDWKILNEDIYGQFRKDELKDHNLGCNYRSGANIVEFNNSFFEWCARAAGQLYGEGGDVIGKIYEGFRQEVSRKGEKTPGCVQVDFLSNEEVAFMDNALDALPGKVEQLLQGGWRLKDIAVLVRTGKQGNAVARKLIDAGYEIISSDSLYVSSCDAVQKVVNILRQMDNPESGSLRVLRQFCSIPDAVEMEKYSLYQLCENIIRETLEPGERAEVAYLQAFLDLVLEFAADEGTNISRFIKWWDESGVRCTISAPDDMDAIRIMTIHKSKGLGFNVVIIPFLKENLDHQATMAPDLWCVHEGYPVPVRYSKGLVETSFADEYLNERLCAYIDSLNMVYVAFTRPKRELHVFAPVPKTLKGGKYAEPSAVSDILFAYWQQHAAEKGWEDGIRTGECGTIPTGGEETGKCSLGRAFAEKVDAARTGTVARGGSIGDGESIREHGIAMHYVFSLIDYPQSVDAAVERACLEGVASCSAGQLKGMVVEKIESVAEYGWFSDAYKVFNECSIITPQGEEKRPDRVLVDGDRAIVIDYKFGEHTSGDASLHNRYKKQVGRYMELLTCMGFRKVEGYLWYVSSDEVISV